MNVDGLKGVVAKMDYKSGRLYNWCYRVGVSLLGRIMYPIQILRNKRMYVDAESYFPEKPRKSRSKILREQLAWSLKHGDINKYYFMWGGDIQGASMSGFVPWFKWVNARQCKNKMPKFPTYDAYNSVCLLRDKFYFETILKKTGYNTPTNVMMINEGKLYLLNQTGMNSVAQDLSDIVNYEIDAFCKRNVSYGGGADCDVFPLKITNRKIYIRDKEISLDDFKKIILNSTCSWVIQERIKNQAQFMSQFHPSSVNTLRVVTVKNGTEVDALCAFARFGVNGRGSDNWSSGGVLVGIKVDTGKFEEYALFKPGVGTKCFEHPNTKVSFIDKVVPEWDKVVEYVKSLHELFYDIHSIGWDICLTEDGPLIIEGNDNWDTIDAQFYHPGKELFDKYFS